MDGKGGESRAARIGILVTLGAVVLMAFLFFIGSEQRLFTRKYDYKVRLDSVSGLAEGNPVEVSGVTVGTVRDITLSRNPKVRTVDITIAVEKKYADLIREDSRVRLKKLGLIAADTYIDITPGSPDQPVLEPGSVIPAQRATNVDALISSGEDLVDNFVQISYSLKNILQRVDRGEGLIGELTTKPQVKERLTDTMIESFSRIDKFLAQIESGKGLIGKLVYDDQYADQLTSSLSSAASSLKTVTGSLEQSFASGKGALPMLLSDPAGRDKVTKLLDRLTTTSENLAVFSAELRRGQGVIPRLVGDKEYADQTLKEFRQLVTRLDDVSRKLSQGEGTAGLLINDPSVYESLNDVLIGINQSPLLRWLIRNRQKKGIEARYDAERRGGAKRSASPAEPVGAPKEEIAAPAPAPMTETSPRSEPGAPSPAAKAIAPSEPAAGPPPEVPPPPPDTVSTPEAPSAQAPPPTASPAPKEPNEPTDPNAPSDPNEPKFRGSVAMLAGPQRAGSQGFRCPASGAGRAATS